MTLIVFSYGPDETQKKIIPFQMLNRGFRRFPSLYQHGNWWLCGVTFASLLGLSDPLSATIKQMTAPSTLFMWHLHSLLNFSLITFNIVRQALTVQNPTSINLPSKELKWPLDKMFLLSTEAAHGFYNHLWLMMYGAIEVTAKCDEGKEQGHYHFH